MIWNILEHSKKLCVGGVLRDYRASLTINIPLGARERFSTMSVWFHQAKASIGNVQHVLPVRKVLDPRISAMVRMRKYIAKVAMLGNLGPRVTEEPEPEIGRMRTQPRLSDRILRETPAY